jgi:predicted RNase H-related nuclease YkuK (DUF458 family)
MGDVDDNLSNALNLPKSEPEPKQEVVRREVKSIKTDRTEADRDYTEVRDNLKRIIEKSEEALETLLEVATESQNPRAYEVVAQLIASSLEANNKLIHLHKQIKDIKKQEPGKTTTVTNNSIFVGNTADLQKMLRSANTKMIEDMGKEDTDAK